VYGQSSKEIIDEFIYKIDTLLDSSAQNVTNINVSNRIFKRMSKSSGRLDHGTKTIKRKIKYFKSGLKREKVKLSFTLKGHSYKIMKVILLNDEYFKITYYGYKKMKEFDTYKRIVKEELIDKRIYRKKIYEGGDGSSTSVGVWSGF